jgi:hypothetical protein
VRFEDVAVRAYPPGLVVPQLPNPITLHRPPIQLNPQSRVLRQADRAVDFDRIGSRGKGLQHIQQACPPASGSRTVILANIRPEYSTTELILINRRIDRAA